MAKSKSEKKALRALNYDLFQTKDIAPPAPATIGHKIKEHTEKEKLFTGVTMPEAVISVQNPTKNREKGELPTVTELYQLFDRYNWLYFDGKLPQAKIEYSNRMYSAGSYTPAHRLIKISRKYHEIFPEDIHDTLKHEMIHIIHYYHDADFKREAKRIGATVKAKTHPKLRKPPKYMYLCPNCGKEYPRQKRLVMASCGYCSRGGKFDERYKLRLKK